MANGIITEVKEQLNSGSMKSEDANRFILRMLIDMYERGERADVNIEKVDQKIAAVDDRVRGLEERFDQMDERFVRYPSLIWLAFNRTKVFIFLVTVFVVILMVLIDPQTLILIGESMLRFIGIAP